MQPVVIPFFFLHDPAWAIRTKTLIAIAMLYIAGYQWGKNASDCPLRSGSGLALSGVVMVLIAIPLDG